MGLDIVGVEDGPAYATNSSTSVSFEDFRKHVLKAFVVAAAAEDKGDALRILKYAEDLIAQSGVASAEINKLLTRENMTMIRRNIEAGLHPQFT